MSEMVKVTGMDVWGQIVGLSEKAEWPENVEWMGMVEWTQLFELLGMDDFGR